MAEIFEHLITLRKNLAQTYISAKNLYSFGDFDNDDDPEYFWILKLSILSNVNNVNVTIGAFQTPDRRYLEYVDGSLMNDGLFNDVGMTFFGDVYGTGENVFKLFYSNFRPVECNFKIFP